MMPRSLSRLLVLSALALGALAPASADAQSAARLRIGLEAGFGGEWGTPRGPAAGVFGQLGLQASPLVGLFYQPSLYVHGLATDEPNAFVATGHLAMLDFTVGLLQLGVGAGVDVGRFATCDENSCTDGERSTDPAVGGRIAIVPRIRGPLARVGIPIAAHIHSAFLDRESSRRLTSIVLTIGIQRF